MGKQKHKIDSYSVLTGKICVFFVEVEHADSDDVIVQDFADEEHNVYFTSFGK